MGLTLPFLKDNKLSGEEKTDLENKFWLMVLRAGAMDSEISYQVLMNYKYGFHRNNYKVTHIK